MVDLLLFINRWIFSIMSCKLFFGTVLVNKHILKEATNHVYTVLHLISIKLVWVINSIKINPRKTQSFKNWLTEPKNEKCSVITATGNFEFHCHCCIISFFCFCLWNRIKKEEKKRLFYLLENRTTIRKSHEHIYSFLLLMSSRPHNEG